MKDFDTIAVGDIKDNIIQKKSSISIPKLNRRQRTIISTALALSFILLIIMGGFLISNDKISTNLLMKNLKPSLEHPFGTDWLGRDMLARTFKGLTLSLSVGAIATSIGLFIAMVLGLLAATMGKFTDGLIAWTIDLFLSLPHIVALILISVVVGGGKKGVIIGVALTHWAGFTRVVRAEVMQIRHAEFIQVSRKMGKSSWWIATKHVLPHLIPQFFVGLILLFPHAILHEAAITFLGFGLSPHKPAIGIILSESMQYMSTGMWWLAFFPGLCLLLVVWSIHVIGDNLRAMIDPHSAHE